MTSFRTDSGLPIIRFSIPECFSVTSTADGSDVFGFEVLSAVSDIFLLPVCSAELRYNAFLSRWSTYKMLLLESGVKVKVFRLSCHTGRNNKVLLYAVIHGSEDECDNSWT